MKNNEMESKVDSPFTPEEKEVLDLLTEAHNKFCKLPATHRKESTEWVSGVHTLQSILGLRLLRRIHPETFKSGV